jgi:RNA polymerase sigma-70 factor, ECF subfamily
MSVCEARIGDVSEQRVSTAPDDLASDDLARARGGDDGAFGRLVAPLRRELHAHCYRMLGSVHDAEDALQDGMLRAWKALPAFEGRSSLRSWLYSVVTHACLDAARRRGRRAMPVDLGPASDHAVVDAAPRTDVAWLEPYPDAMLAEVRYEQREAVELAFVAACQHLPGNQRAALLLFEVLGFSVAEIAQIMDTTTASVNSALQRARATVAGRAPAETQQRALRTIEDKGVREIVARFAGALERGDADALVALLTEDVTWSMPPFPHWYRGRPAVTAFAVAMPLSSCGNWAHRPVTANGQAAVASYLRRAGDGPFRAWSIDVLTLTADGRIAAVTSFLDATEFARFGLPPSVDGPRE